MTEQLAALGGSMSGALHIITHTPIMPTTLRSGTKVNVLPDRADLGATACGAGLFSDRIPLGDMFARCTESMNGSTPRVSACSPRSRWAWRTR